MADLSQGNFANVFLQPGESLRVSTGGQATVASAFGAPAGTTTINANSQLFGPYAVPAKLRVTAVSGACSYGAPVLVPAQVDASTGQFAPPVSGAGRVISTVTTDGDSFEALSHQAFIPTSATVSGGVATLTFAAAHGLYTGTKINATGGPSAAVNGVRVPITRTGANSLTYPVPGAPDGAITGGPATYQIFAWSQQTITGIYPHLQRLTKGSLRLLQAGGMSGYRMADVLGAYETSLRPFKSNLHIHWGYFNDLQYGITPDASAASVQEILARRKADGCLAVVCVSAMAVQSGVWAWPALTAPLVTMTDASAALWILKWNRIMSAWCAANGVHWIDVHTASVDPATGYAAAGACKSGDIHPAMRICYTAAKLIYTKLSALFSFVPRALATSKFDNVSADASNRNVCRAAPSEQGAGGTPGAGQTVVYTAWANAANIPANRWRTNGGNLYFTPNGTANAAQAPVHTTGFVTNTSGDGATWHYMGRAEGDDGVPAGYRAINPATAFAMVALVDKPTGAKALRNTTYATQANDSSLQSYTFTLSDLVAGEVLDVAFLASLVTGFTGAANGPSGQNVKSYTGYIEWIVDGVTCLVYEQSGGVAAANEMITEDITDAGVVLEEVVVPTGSITLGRVHLQAQTSGPGQFATDMGCLTALH